jgi:hypothetical protein
MNRHRSLGLRLAAFFLSALVGGAAPPPPGGLRFVTVGLNTGCPSGVPA